MCIRLTGITFLTPLLLSALLLAIPLRGQGCLGLPIATSDKQGIKLTHKAFNAAYDIKTHCPLWVAWTLTQQRTKGSNERDSRFTPDPQLKGKGATHEDYTRSGYDRGHMCPAADNRWNNVAMKESFYTSNICPQTPRLNRGSWKQLEERLRRRAETGDTLYIVCGPLFTAGKRTVTIGTTGVTVPDRFYKVVCTFTNGQPHAAGFIFTNSKGKNNPAAIVPVDSIERLSGLDFFPNLPNDVERVVEAQVERSRWQ